MFVHPELVEGYLGIDSKYPAFKQRKSRAFPRGCLLHKIKVVGATPCRSYSKDLVVMPTGAMDVPVLQLHGRSFTHLNNFHIKMQSFTR